MSQSPSEQGLLILMAPVSLEETLVDLLLQKDQISGFTTTNVNGHGRQHAELSLVEQVAGRQKRVQFMMHASFAELQELVVELKQVFSDTGMHYILMPVAEAQSI